MATQAYLQYLKMALSIQATGATIPFAGTQTANPTPSEAINGTFGTGVGQTNIVYFNTITLAPSGTLTLDLLNGSSALLDLFGDVLTPIVRVKQISAWLYNIVGYTASEVTLGGGSNYWPGPWGSGTKPLFTGSANSDGFCHLYGDARSDGTGWVVTPSTAHNLLLTNNDSVNSAQLLLMIAGCSV